MKLIIFTALVGLCLADVSHLSGGSSYLPPHATSRYNSGASSYSGYGSYNAGSGSYSSGGFGTRSQDINAHTLRQSSDVNDHSFAYDFETSNGIKVQQHGKAANGVQSQGAFAYKGDDGHDYSITYTADENGYRPQGAHLPTPPPVPEEILRSLEQNAREEAAGIYNEGSYQEDYADSTSSQYRSGQSAHQASRQYLAPVIAARTSGFRAHSGYHY